METKQYASAQVNKDFKPNGKTILALSLPAAGLIIIASCIGLFTPDFYYRETLNWQAQSQGQDIIDLFLVTPFLIITAVLVYKKHKASLFLWAGCLIYLIYTYMIFCFSVHFNSLFIIYCLILGLAFYSLMYFIYISIGKQVVCNFKVSKFTAVYFIIISVMFYVLWLSEIAPALISGTVPKSLAETGLSANPVHVIDLSVFLPGIFITGVLLLKRHFTGYFAAPLLLTFFILMNITIGFLIVFMKARGLEADIMLTAIMAVLAIFSSFLLFLFFKKE